METVELVLDGRLDALVRRAWDRLAAEGLPSLARHTHPTNRPHLTVAACSLVPPSARAPIRAAVAALPLPVRLAGLRRFEGRRPSLVWLVAPDPALEELHRRVWRALEGAPGRNPLHAPDRWVPHVSLARGAGLGHTAPAALESAATAAGTVVAARGYDSATRSTWTIAPLPDPPQAPDR